jgi:hypothetical protein
MPRLGTDETVATAMRVYLQGCDDARFVGTIEDFVVLVVSSPRSNIVDGNATINTITGQLRTPWGRSKFCRHHQMQITNLGREPLRSNWICVFTFRKGGRRSSYGSEPGRHLSTGSLCGVDSFLINYILQHVSTILSLTYK